VGVRDCVDGNGGALGVDWGWVGDLRVRPIVGKWSGGVGSAG